MPYLSTSEVMIHEEALYQLDVPLSLPLNVHLENVYVCDTFREEVEQGR